MEVTATFRSTSERIGDFTGALPRSVFIHASSTASDDGQTSGFLSATSSVSVKTGPCSRSSIPAAMASGQVTAQR